MAQQHLPTLYCTHSFGPLMTITGRRPVQVTGFTSQHNDKERPTGYKSGIRPGIELVVMDNGAVARSVHGALKREPGSVHYRVYGTKGSMESELFTPGYAPKGGSERFK